jgi:DNA-binding CsgD family transcriptional regulator
MRFLKARTDADVLGAPQPRRAFLPFKKEVEPSIFVFGVVFGLSFALLMISGVQALLWGMFAVLLGAAVVLLLDVAGFALNVTITQRALLVVAVAACLVIPFADGWARLVCLCFNAAAWAAFNAVNWSILVRMSAAHKLPVFYSIAAGASVSPWGFVAGWILSLVFAYLDFSSAFLSTLMLLLAFLLVAVLMLFIPNSAHHDEPAAVAAKPSALRLTGNEMSEKALFWMRVDEISRLYGLSPRERDVLGYLVKGRNANYIQKELVVSPHTAKSHIYNIYRKLDIHSQQKLMDFVEEFPLEVADPPGTSRRP